MKDPAFLFFSADFQIGTEDMTDEQVGKYIRLMCRQHLKGHIPKERMLKICGTYDKEIFDKFIQDEDGLYYSPRLQVEIDKRRAFSKSRSENRLGKKKNQMSDKSPKTPKTSRPKKEFMKFEGLSYINLTQKEYETLIKKYGQDRTITAIKIFDNWLEKKGKTASQYIGKPHYAHFKSDGWVWERADAQLKTQLRGNTNYGI